MSDTTSFEADLDPETRAPRIRFNFANGWAASIVLRIPSPDGCDFVMASLAACPTGAWGTGATELGETEASADEASAYLAAVAARPKPATRRIDR